MVTLHGSNQSSLFFSYLCLPFISDISSCSDIVTQMIRVPLNHKFLSFNQQFPRGIFPLDLFSQTILVIMLVDPIHFFITPQLNFHHFRYFHQNLHHIFPTLLLGYCLLSIRLILAIPWQTILSILHLKLQSRLYSIIWSLKLLYSRTLRSLPLYPILSLFLFIL